MNIETYTCLHSALFSYKRLIKAKLNQIGNRNLSPEQVIILFGLMERETSVSDLSYSGTNGSYNVGKLNKFGYINCDTDPEDKRKTLVTITKKGKDLVNALDRLLDIKIDNQAVLNSIRRLETTVLAEIR